MEYNLKLYDHLLQFTLFQGMSRSDLQQLAGNTKFGFQKLPPDRWVAREGEACRQLLFLIGGSLSVTTKSDDGGYQMTERLTAPYLLQPEALFGLAQRYSHTFRTTDTCHFITLSKSEVSSLLDKFLVIRLNLLGMMATAAQRANRRQWRSGAQGLPERIVRFFIDHSVYPAGPKVLHILMTRLAQEMGCTRLEVSVALHELQQRQLIELHRGRIVIHSLERLLM